MAALVFPNLVCVTVAADSLYPVPRAGATAGPSSQRLGRKGHRDPDTQAQQCLQELEEPGGRVRRARWSSTLGRWSPSGAPGRRKQEMATRPQAMGRQRQGPGVPGPMWLNDDTPEGFRGSSTEGWCDSDV